MEETGNKRRKYSPEFKITVRMDMRHNHLSDYYLKQGKKADR